MTKTLKDCLLEGGIVNKIFIDPNYAHKGQVAYMPRDIKTYIKKRPIVSGIVIEPKMSTSYMKALDLCLNHVLVEGEK